MSNKVFQLSIGKLGDTVSDWKRKVTPDCLHYCPASAGGWGIIRVGLLVPESVMLFVSPNGCGRHGAIAGIQHGFKKRLFFLHLDEMDIVTGQHMEKIPQAVTEILSKVYPQPKAILICATCIDDLLVSDYDGLARQLEIKHGIPVRICRMDPIAMDGKKPPTFTVQEAIYDFLQPSSKKEQAVNIIGNFSPIDAESEFYEVMAGAGVSKVRHIAACRTFKEFQQMSRSTLNILIGLGGRLAAYKMKNKLKIPHCFIPVTYGLERITQFYQKLGEFLGVSLNVKQYCLKAQDDIESYRRRLGPLTVAVGQSVNASPFELARALIEYGFQVRYIFADVVLDFDLEHVKWLKCYASDIKVFTNVHPTMVNFLNQRLTVDLAVGFDAGYFCPGAKILPLTLDSQPFGYRGVVYLLREILKALENPRSHREQMYESGLVI